MAEKIARAVLEIGVDDKQVKGGLKGINKQAAKTAKHIKGISAGVNFLVFTKAAGMAVKALKAMAGAVADLGARGAAVDDVSQAFSTLSENMGSTADVMIGALRAGVKGTMSDFELMKLANKGLGAGLITSAEDMETLASGARSLGKATGMDTKQAFETMTTAIASGRTAQLKQLGLFVDNKLATENYAAAIGKTVSTMSDADRAAALSAATLVALRERLALVKPAAADFGEVMDFAKAQVSNFTDNLGRAIAVSPAVQAAMAKVGEVFQRAFGGENNRLIKEIVELLVSFGVGMTYVAQGGVIVAQVLLTAFYAVKTIILGITTAIVATGLSFANFIADSLELAAKLPGVGDKFKGVAETARSVATALKETTIGLALQTVEAAKGVAGQGEYHDALNATAGMVVEIRDALTGTIEATAATTAVVTTAVTDMGTADAQAAAMIEATVAKVLAARTRLEQQLALIGLEAQERRLLELQQQEANELAAIERNKEFTTAQQTELMDATRALYAAKVAAATEHELTLVELATQAGFATRAQLQETADKAVANYNHIRSSGLYTAAALKKAWADAEKAKQDLQEGTTEHAKLGFEGIADAASSVLSSMFGKSKAGAIAATVINTAQAIIKTFAEFGFPWGLIPAAAMAAAGAKQIAQIKSQSASFAKGTPGLDFASFGAASSVDLHGQEAVVPRGGGHILAGEIASAMPGNRDDGSLEELQAIRESLDDLPSTITRAWKNAMASA